MCYGREHRQKQTTETSARRVCGDRFPHLRSDFMTCTHACTRSYGHRPETPHRCTDGHEWYLDETNCDRREADAFHPDPDEHGKDDISH